MPAISVAGATSRPTILPRSSSSDGRVASAFTPSTSEQLPTDRAAQDHEFLVILGVGRRHLRSGDRIFDTAMPVGPLKRWAMPSMAVPFRARTPDGSWPPGTAPAARMRERRVGHLGHRHAGIVGDHHGAGLREDTRSGLRRLPPFWLFPLCSPSFDRRRSAKYACSSRLRPRAETRNPGQKRCSTDAAFAPAESRGGRQRITNAIPCLCGKLSPVNRATPAVSDSSGGRPEPEGRDGNRRVSSASALTPSADRQRAADRPSRPGPSSRTWRSSSYRCPWRPSAWPWHASMKALTFSTMASSVKLALPTPA